VKLPSLSRRPRALLAMLAALVFIAALAALATGEVPPGAALRVLLARLGLVSAGDVPFEHDQVVWGVRAPRVVFALVAGYGLSLCGTVMQGVFRNPLADPYLLGVAGGATAGAAAVIALDLDRAPLAESAGALCGGLLAVSLVYRLSLTRLGRLSEYTLILAGVAMAAFFGALTSFLIYASEGDDLQKIVHFLFGGTDRVTLGEVPVPLAVVAAGALCVQAAARDLDALALGDDMAVHLGVDPRLVKKLFLALATVLTAAIVALAGVIGFVGLIVPHVLRLVLGPGHRLLLPASGLAGALFLLACDTAARTVAYPREVPVGIVTALVGAPVLVGLLRRPRAPGTAGGTRAGGR